MTRTGMRLGSAATRDSISFGRTGEADRHGDGKSKKLPAVQGPSNPLGDSIQNALIYGSSQSGRPIRTFLQLGFNEGKNHRGAVERGIPHKASNRGGLKTPSAPPTPLSGAQHPQQQYPAA